MIDGQKYQWQRLVDKFHANANQLTTYDFTHDPAFAAEYRRLICDLIKKGYVINRRKITPSLWSYTLIEEEASGQLRFVA